MSQRTMKITEIEVGERFRKDFGDLERLAESIRRSGLLQPIVVDDANNLVAGERRLRACKSLGMHEVPVVRLAELDEVQRKELELEENIQRKQLTWIEEVKARAELHRMKQELYGRPKLGRPVEGEEKGWGLKDTATSLGMSKAQLSMDIRLAEALERLPELADARTKVEALKELRRLEDEALKYVRSLQPGEGKQEPVTKPGAKPVIQQQLVVFYRDKCVCQYCGLDGKSDLRVLRNLCVDHLVPVSRGGASTFENKVLACMNCNAVKGEYDPRKHASSGSREALLTAARQHVQGRLEARLAYFENVLQTLKEQA